MIYFDNAATTKMRREAIDVYLETNERYFANPSSLHQLGLDAEKKLRYYRKKFADDLGVKESEIYFTPSATFSNNLAIRGSFGPGKAIISPIEHSAVYRVVKDVYDDISYLPVDKGGKIVEDEIANKLDKDTRFASVIMVNNEIGTRQNIEAIVKKIKKINPNIIVHVDGVQAFGKYKIDLKKMKVDMFTASSHKIHGPKGIGLLYVSEKVRLNPITLGGGQEKGLVSGTENLPAVAAFYKAYELMRASDFSEVKLVKEYILRELMKIKDSKLVGYEDEKDSSSFILNMAFKNIKSEPLIHLLEMEDIYVSSGSACSKGKDNRILDAIGLEEEYLDGAIRMSFSVFSNMDQAKEFVICFKRALATIRNIME